MFNELGDTFSPRAGDETSSRHSMAQVAGARAGGRLGETIRRRTRRQAWTHIVLSDRGTCDRMQTTGRTYVPGLCLRAVAPIAHGTARREPVGGRIGITRPDRSREHCCAGLSWPSQTGDSPLLPMSPRRRTRSVLVAQLGTTPCHVVRSGVLASARSSRLSKQVALCWSRAADVSPDESRLPPG